MSEDTHTHIDEWAGHEFPFDYEDDYVMERVHELLPEGYWVAEDHSSDGDLLHLMRWDKHAED